MLNKLLSYLPKNVKKHYLRPLMIKLKNKTLYNRQYDPQRFFDDFHGASTSSEDSNTIAPDFPKTDARYHYNSLESQIIKYCKRKNLDVKHVLDLGSGTGHWIDFYKNIFNAETITGVDISQEACKKLIAKYETYNDIKILKSHILEVGIDDEEFDVVNAIGVIFHIVSDNEFRDVINFLYDKTAPSGVLIASDLFGLISANVQFEPQHFETSGEYRTQIDSNNSAHKVCNKRVRSKYFWRKTLKEAGYSRIEFENSTIPNYIDTPENNLVFARK